LQRIALIFVVTALAMWLIFGAAQWYADNSSLPRYCNEPAVAIEHVRKILTFPQAAASKNKRPYAVAAKLLFLIPRLDGETVQNYLDRLRRRIDETCRVP